MSDYRLQIIHIRHPSGPVFGWQPGDRVETDLVEELASRLKAKGVGWFRSEAKTLTAVRSAMAELLLDLKGRV